MKRSFAVGVVLSALLYGCGSSGSGKALPLYFTDAPGDEFPAVVVTIHEVNLCSDNNCLNKVNLYLNEPGLTLDLVQLNGVLQYVTTATVPERTYNRLEVILSGAAEVTDDSQVTHPAAFLPMTANGNKPNELQCPPELEGKCYIRYNGAVQPFSMGKLIIDFDLKDLEVEIDPCTETDDPAS